MSEFTTCQECGMACARGEFHPFGACLMFKGCHDGEMVRASLNALAHPDHSGDGGEKTDEQVAYDAWIKNARAEGHATGSWAAWCARARLNTEAATVPQDGDKRGFHELKTDDAVFEAVWNGMKTHEIRFNDRNFAVGDRLWLRETRYTGAEMRGPEARPLEYTGRQLTRTVSHVLDGYGLQPGWVILSFAPLSQKAVPVQKDGGDGLEALRVALQRYIDCDPARDKPGDTPAAQARATLAQKTARPIPDQIVQAWAERHDIKLSGNDLRAAFDDAASSHLIGDAQ